MVKGRGRFRQSYWCVMHLTLGDWVMGSCPPAQAKCEGSVNFTEHRVNAEDKVPLIILNTFFQHASESSINAI